MQFQQSNSAGGGKESKQYTQKGKSNYQGKNKQDNKQQQAQSSQPVDWANLYAPKANEQQKTQPTQPTSQSFQNNQKFNSFVPTPVSAPAAPKNEMNELQQMMSESKKGDQRGQKTDNNVDDAILSIDTQSSKPPTFSNKNKPKNKKDANFELQIKTQDQRKTPGAKKERQLTKTHSSWMTGDQGASLNELMLTEGGAYDQFADKNTTYDESLYNTTIDYKSISREQIAHANKIEKEIMSKDAKGNIHQAEERGQIYLRDNEDEEIMYSGVIRNKAIKLSNPKKFTCFRKKVVCLQNQSPKSENKGLVSEEQWSQFQMKASDTVKPITPQSFQNQSKPYNQSKSNYQSQGQYGQGKQPINQEQKIENVTGVYRGTGSQQVQTQSNTQNSQSYPYISQQMNQTPIQPPKPAMAVQNASSMKLPSSGFVPNAQPFIPKSVSNVQPFQPKEEIKSSAPVFVPNQSFTPKFDSSTKQDFNQNQSFTPQNSYNADKQMPQYQNTAYQAKQVNKYNQNSSNSYQGANNSYQGGGNNYRQNNGGGNQSYTPKSQNSYQNQSSNGQGQNQSYVPKNKPYENKPYENKPYGQNSYGGQNNGYNNQQQTQFMPVQNNSSYQSNQNSMGMNQQQNWGGGNLYHVNQQAAFNVNTQQQSHENQNQYSQNKNSHYNQNISGMNNNYNQSLGSNGGQNNISQTGSFQNTQSSGMKIGANVFKPSSYGYQ